MNETPISKVNETPISKVNETPIHQSLVDAASNVPETSTASSIANPIEPSIPPFSSSFLSALTSSREPGQSWQSEVTPAVTSPSPMVLIEPVASDSPAPPPLFRHYTVSTFPLANGQIELAMTHESETPIDSFYLLMRNTPPQIPAKDAEKVMVGNRSILGWKLSPRGRSIYSHSFDVSLEPPNLPRSVSSASLPSSPSSVRFVPV